MLSCPCTLLTLKTLKFGRKLYACNMRYDSLHDLVLTQSKLRSVKKNEAKMMVCNTKINTIYSKIETATSNGESTRGLTVELNKELATLKKTHEALKKDFERRYKEIRAIEEKNSLKN